MTNETNESLGELIAARFPDQTEAIAPIPDGGGLLHSMLSRGSCRAFQPEPVEPEVLHVLCAAALASPTKSDLQQRDIIILRDPAQRAALAELVSGQTWVSEAPGLLVFCGNNRRQRLLHEWSGTAFANDHLDALFNAAADAAIALGAFVTAAEALGLGCCPISAVRNEAQRVSELLDLPQHVFPFAGLAVGYPARKPDISMRLPLGATCHVDRYQEGDLPTAVSHYDRKRSERQPYAKQRDVETFGTSDSYGWSQDKIRQYAKPERADFGDFVRSKGFRLD